MSKRISICVLALFTLVLSCSPTNDTLNQDNRTSVSSLTQSEFEVLLERLAEGWNAGNTRMAANCFTGDALYVEPPDKQRYSGRPALYEFFGGESGRSGEMSMEWHHIVFNPATQIGAGEFTFTYGATVHGVAMIKVRNKRISRWREYWYESELDWDKFIGDSKFDNDTD